MAQDGLARAIYPAHTTLDGDTVFAAATGTPPPRRSARRARGAGRRRCQCAGPRGGAGGIRGHRPARRAAKLAGLPQLATFTTIIVRFIDSAPNWPLKTAMFGWGGNWRAAPCDRARHVRSFAMRLAAIACALMVVMCVAVFGAILLQRPSIPTASPAPAATATDGSVRAVITTLEERDAAPAPVAPLKPSVATDVAPKRHLRHQARHQLHRSRRPHPPRPAPRSCLARQMCQAHLSCWRRARLRPPPRRRHPRLQLRLHPPHQCSRPLRLRPRVHPLARVIPMPWGSRAWSRSTPPAAPASASSTSRATTSCAKARWCSPSTTAPGRRTPRRCSPRSPHTAPRRSSSRSACMPPTSPASSSRWPPPGHAVGSHTWCHQDLSKTKGYVPGQREDPNRRVQPQGRDREGHQRRALGGRRTDGALFPLPGAAAAAGADRLSRQAQHRASSQPTSIRSTSRCASPSRSGSR